MANDFLTDPLIFDTAGGFFPGTAPVQSIMFSGNTNTASTVTLYKGKNTIPNWEFEDWFNGAAVPPAHWILSGANATIATETTVVPSAFACNGLSNSAKSAKLTRVNADCMIEFNVLPFLSPPMNEIAYWVGRTIIATCLVYATVASRAYIATFDGTTTTTSSAHSGGSVWENIYTAPVAVHGSADELSIHLIVKTGNTSGYFVLPVLMEAHRMYHVLGTEKTQSHTYGSPVPVDGLYLSEITGGNLQVKI